MSEQKDKDLAVLAQVGRMYLDALDADPENEMLTLPEAYRVTEVREAVDRAEERARQPERIHEPLVARVQELLFRVLIDIGPVESVRDGWHEAECSCMWSTTGLETVVEEAAYAHIFDVHMALFDEVVAEVRKFDAEEASK